jgi:hypothetical protein
MPRLYCTEHGKEHEATCHEEQENYRLLGETVLIVKGTLTSGPWRCDRCNTRLTKGNPAYLVTAFSRHFAEELDGYDYGYERQYLAMERAEAKLYGAEPPGGIPAPDTLRGGCS